MKWPSGDKHWTRRMPERVRRGATHPSAKLTPQQIEEVCALFAQFNVARTEIARHFGVSRITIWRHLKAAGLL